jgi:hypothetical protein
MLHRKLFPSASRTSRRDGFSFTPINNVGARSPPCLCSRPGAPRYPCADVAPRGEGAHCRTCCTLRSPFLEKKPPKIVGKSCCCCRAASWIHFAEK